MASLDFIYDLAKILRSQRIDFFLLTFQDNKKECQIDAFLELNNRYTVKTLVEIRDRIDDLIKAEQKKRKKKGK
jgi:hypothetical protein